MVNDTFEVDETTRLRRSFRVRELKLSDFESEDDKVNCNELEF